MVVLPHLLLFGFAGCVQRNVLTSHLGLPIDRTPRVQIAPVSPERQL